MNLENKYIQIMQYKNKDTPILVPLLLFIKSDFLNNDIFYFIVIFFRFLGLLIICGNYSNGSTVNRDHLTISIIFRAISSYGLTGQLRISNLVYIIISIILFVLLFIMALLYYRIIKAIKYKNMEKISPFKFQIILDHLLFLLFPYIIEFLSFIFYIEFNGDNFIIKKSINSIFNLIILVINIISIIAYNIQSFFHILCVNNPLDEENNKIKIKYGRNKIIIICLMQNIIIVECLVLYLTDSLLTVYKTILNILLILFFVGLYLYSHYNFNYNTTTNYFINILSIFCFFSLLFEMLLNIMGYTIESYVTLLFYTIFKIICSLCFDYFSNILYDNKSIKLLQEEIFKIYNDKNISDNQNYDILYYFYDIYRKIKKNNGKGDTKRMINIILLHYEKCHNKECKCKYIQVFPQGKKYIEKYINNFLERINFILESIFVELDYQKNYNLTLLLAEHYYNCKNNPLLSYSMIQTILHFHTKSLSINEILILFTALSKYINKCDNSKFETNKDLEKKISILKKVTLFKNIFNSYKYLIKSKKVILKYAKDYLQLIKYKENMEETIQLVKDENNDIIRITSYFLTTKNLSGIINILLGEYAHNNNLTNYLKHLDANKLPIDIIYKFILFSELFLCGKIPDEILSLMNSINSGVNIYTQKITQSTLFEIEKIYIDKHLQNNSNYYLIFKFSNGINIHYLDESLSKKMGYSQKDLLNYSIEKIMPKEFKISHSLAIIKFLINEKNITINNFEHFIFDRDMQMYPATLSGICMPGLGKYLFCIVKIFLRTNKNEYYFYLDKNFDCISISHNFYSNYHISLNILNRYKISPLELIDFKIESLDDLNKDILKINKYKQNLDLKTDYFYAQKLFKEKSKFYSGQNNFQLVKIMKKNENFTDEENMELKSSKEENHINLIEKLINIKYQYVYLHNNLVRKKEKRNRKLFFDKIDELMNRYNNENDKNIKKLISFSSSFLTKYTNQIDKVDFGYFNIEYGLSMLYNTYFYIFKMIEICKDVPLLKDSNNNLVYQKNDLTSSNSFGSLKQKNTKLRTSKEIEKSSNDQNKNTENKTSKSNINAKIYKVQCFNYVTPLVIIILGSLLITYIIILFYQRNMVSSSYKGFLVFYYNYYQRDQLYALYSVSLSSYYHYIKTTDLSDVMTENEYIELIKRYSIEFQNSFHKFYDIYISNNNDDTSQIHFIFDEIEVFKISNYYNQTSIIDDYIKESEYISYISRLSSIEDNLDDIIEDSKLVFFGKIFKNQDGGKTKTKSYYIQMLYYLSKNYQSLFNTIYSELEAESTEKFNDLSKNSKVTYLCIEIMGFIIIVFFFIIVLIFLHQTNTAIFRNIVNMFVNYNQDETFHYKNKKDNYLLIKIISGFVVLINDFNLDNLHKLQYIINQSSSKSISMDSTIDIKDDNSTTSFGIIDEEKNKKNDIKNTKTVNFNNANIYSNKDELMNQILENKNSTNNSELVKFNLSSSKTALQNNTLGDTLKQLNIPQKTIDQNTTKNISNTTVTTNNLITGNNKTLSKKHLMVNSITSSKNQSNYLSKKKLSKLSNQNVITPNIKQKNVNIDNVENDEEKMTVEIFMAKLKNNGIRNIKISRIVLLILFIFVVIYVSVKIYISLDFISEIKGIFDDFGVLSYRYSSMYYYFNSLRTLLVFPDFGSETIFETMNANMADRLKKMNVVLDFKLVKYPAVGYYYWVTGTNMKKPRPSPEYINITCYEDQKCREIINNKKYDVLSEGLKMAVTSMYQQIINIYDDYKKEKEKNNIDENVEASFIKEKFINKQFEQIDINLNYVFTCIENRIYEAFMTDLISLVNKYNLIIEALNICAVIYCFFVAFTCMTFIIFYLRRITKRIEDTTIRINNAFCHILLRNINSDNKTDNSSFITTDN